MQKSIDNIMNESFSHKRFLALIQSPNWKWQLIGEVLAVIFMILIYLFWTNSINIFVIAFLIFSSAHRNQFLFMTSHSELSRFLLQPASTKEKFIALVTKCIVYPGIIIITIQLGIYVHSMLFPFYAVKTELRLGQFYIAILLFSILIYLRLRFRLNNPTVYFLLFITVLIPLLFLEIKLFNIFSQFKNTVMYLAIGHILLSIAILFLSFQQFMRLEAKHAK